jgi:hypothetical protein
MTSYYSPDNLNQVKDLEKQLKKEDLAQQVIDINAQCKQEELARLVKLSKRSVGAAAGLSFLFPIGGYIYTRRWLPLLWFVLGVFTLSFGITASQPTEEDIGDTMLGLSILSGIAASVDNGRAIARSRERLKDMGID